MIPNKRGFASFSPSKCIFGVARARLVERNREMSDRKKLLDDKKRLFGPKPLRKIEQELDKR